MDHRILKLHPLDDHNAFDFAYIEILGASLTTTSSSAGVAKGTLVCNAKDDGSNTVTITFIEPLEFAPIVFYQPTSSNTLVQETSSSVTQLIYTTVQAADASTAAADKNIRILLLIPRGLEVV